MHVMLQIFLLLLIIVIVMRVGIFLKRIFIICIEKKRFWAVC